MQKKRVVRASILPTHVEYGGAETSFARTRVYGVVVVVLVVVVVVVEVGSILECSNSTGSIVECSVNRGSIVECSDDRGSIVECSVSTRSMVFNV